MPKNTKTDTVFFLESLQELLRKEQRARSIRNDTDHISLDSETERDATSVGEQTLPPVSDALLSLLTHLTDLERRVSLAEQRGPLRPFSEIGKAVYEARKRQGLSVEMLAALSSVSPATIHKIEKGSIQVHASKLAEVAHALGIELLVSAP